ncbi:hypothetical protein EDD30_6411 [Couchioplanes caeruleus]|uniref:Uncharacterized protein n=1 Tax=Couchioplanes caeruleus TaxID=56438 RepID=A0A3N1GT47_9ACTN|nr:hypothetical protein EDD30_6411 [Couchioplanes caeruleus]
MTADLRPAIAQTLSTFWLTPTYEEAVAWGTYPYDSDPLARATRPLASPFRPDELTPVLNGHALNQGKRAWLQGSLAISNSQGQQVTAVLRPHYETLGAPATD